jgi:Ser/Thr protein kinase RdoA (MazF antagonist)
MTDSSVPAPVLAAYGFEGAHLEPITIGLLNRTLAVTTRDGRRYILQRLHQAFAPSVNSDIDAITTHLASQGCVTPRLVRTNDASLFIEHEGVWRVLTFLEGRVVDAIGSPELAFAAGKLTGEFHNALRDFQHQFAFSRPGAHDTPAHLAKLSGLLAANANHPEHARIAPLADAVLALGAELGPLPSTRPRIIHGDLKITNLMFASDADTGLALLDLDTMARSTYPIELGDALRSWCNPLGESAAESYCDLALARGAIAGWLEGIRGAVDPDERAALGRGMATIANELASRFLADAYEDRYFGWDANRFASRTEHNLARATSQLALAKDTAAKLPDLAALTEAG